MSTDLVVEEMERLKDRRMEGREESGRQGVGGSIEQVHHGLAKIITTVIIPRARVRVLAGRGDREC